MPCRAGSNSAEGVIVALRGSLEDMRVRDLLEVLRLGNRTGELIVAGMDADARLFFQDGKLVEAVGSGNSGVGVLTEMLSWKDGEFEFRPEAVSPAHHDPELQSAVARVLAFPAGQGPVAVQPLPEAPAPVEPPPTPVVTVEADPRCELLSAFMAGTPFAEYACILDESGMACRQSGSSLHPLAQMSALAAAVHELWRAHPRPELQRVLLEDERGIVVVNRLANRSRLVIVADRGAGLGTVSTAASRLAHQLDAFG
jgi:hypothetical protein